MSASMDRPSGINAAMARADAWLESLRGPASPGHGRGYGGPVAHWWRQCLLYTGPGLDWRYEGILAGYLSLWERTGDRCWLDRARIAGDDLLYGQSGDGHFAASAFELNPATGGTPGEAACDVGLLLLARALRRGHVEAWETYAAAAERNLSAFYAGKLWDLEARAFRESPALRSFVPNKAATACEALFLLADLRGDGSWVERYALPALDHIVAFQVRPGDWRMDGRLEGGIAQDSIGPRRAARFFPFYVARCVPALILGYEWSGQERYADAALAALGFIARWSASDGSLPAVVYPSGRVNRWPGWIAALGDVLRAADLARPLGFDHDLSALHNRLLSGQDASGGFQTAIGFASHAGGRVPDLPDLRDLLHVAGWSAMAFRYLASHVEGRVIPVAEVPAFEADCTFRGQRMRMRETPKELVVSSAGQVRYHWCKGDPWARVAEPEFWLQ